MPYIFLIVAFVFTLLFVYVGVPWIYGRLTRIVMRQHASKMKTLVLTFDDGPGDRLTPLILDTLSKHDAKATFFVLGRNVKGRERLLRKMIAAGHDVCSHGYDHLHYWKVSPWRAVADIKKGWESIDAALGRDSGVYPFRPPGGKLNIVCMLFLIMKKVPIIYWTDVAGDTIQCVRRDMQIKLRPPRDEQTGIMLAHDFDRTDQRVGAEIVNWLVALVNVAHEGCIRTLTVSQFLSERSQKGSSY